MTTERQVRGLYLLAGVIALVGLVLGVLAIVMGHPVEGLLTVLGFWVAAGVVAATTTWAKRADRAKAAQRAHRDDGSPGH